MNERACLARSVALAACFAAVGVTACTSSPTNVSEAESVGVAMDRTRAPLAVGPLLAITGKYGDGCVDREGAWSVTFGKGSSPTPPLSVVVGNSACVLVLAEVVADATYAIDPPIELGASYQPKASSVASGDKQFYVNARLSDASFAGDFAVMLLFSEDPASARAEVGATYASFGAGGEATTVSSPDYTFSAQSLAVQVDAKNVVTDVSGTAALVAGKVAGTDYIVDNGTLSATATYDDIAKVYASSTPTSISGGAVSLAASTFGLLGADLSSPVVRTIVVRNAASGLASYETIRVTFSHP